MPVHSSRTSRDSASRPAGRLRRARPLGLALALWLPLIVAPPAPADAPAAEAPRPDRVDVNAAPAAELAARLPGIGPVKADAIVAHREAHGPFASVEALVEVRGIGPKTLERLGPLVGVGAALERRAHETERRTRDALARTLERVRAGRPSGERAARADQVGASGPATASVARVRRASAPDPGTPDR